jgi:hypothetical protein
VQSTFASELGAEQPAKDRASMFPSRDADGVVS